MNTEAGGTRPVFQAIALEEADKKGEKPSSALSFCRKAKALGYKIRSFTADTRIRCVCSDVSVLEELGQWQAM